jgi:hypothetical protein
MDPSTTRRAGGLLVWLACMPLAGTCAAATAELPWSSTQLRTISDLEAKVVSRDGFFTARTAHYRVASEIDARFTAQVACYLEFFRTQAIDILQFSSAGPSFLADVIIYASRERYQDSLGSRVRSRGQFDWRYPWFGAPSFTVRTFTIGSGEGRLKDCLSILNHEGAHQLLQIQAGRRTIPNLLHEGVATYFQTWDFFQTRAWNLANHRLEFKRELGGACRGGTLPSLSFLAVADPWDVDNFGPMTNTRYACAESMIDFLFTTPDATDFLSRLIARAVQGGSLLPLFMDLRGQKVEDGWRDFVRSRS